MMGQYSNRSINALMVGVDLFNLIAGLLIFSGEYC